MSPKNLIVAFLLGFAIATAFFSGGALTTSDEEVVPTAEAKRFVEIATCLDVPEIDRYECYDTFVQEYATNSGRNTRQILADLEEARGEHEGVENDCHPMTHAVGRWTYQKFGNVGDAFDACDMTCHSGCFHGVMERVFYTDEQLAKGIKHLSFKDLEKTVPTMCERSKFSDPSPPIVFQCLHGGGHALLFSLGYDLEQALKACDLLPSRYDQTSCYGGVFMENVTSFDKKLRDVDPSDPLYPCSKVDDRYKADCYLMQTSLMFEYGLNYEEMAAECSKVGKFAHNCYVSIGRDLSNFVRVGKPEKPLHVCEKTSGEFAESCIKGLVYALIDNTWDGSFAYQYCNALESDTNREACYEASNNFLRSTYQFTDADVEEGCEEFAENQIALCKDKI